MSPSSPNSENEDDYNEDHDERIPLYERRRRQKVEAELYRLSEELTNPKLKAKPLLWNKPSFTFTSIRPNDNGNDTSSSTA